MVVTVIIQCMTPKVLRDGSQSARGGASSKCGAASPRGYCRSPTRHLYWEGESVAAVREVVEGAVGPYADNEYSEMEVDGLMAQLSELVRSVRPDSNPRPSGWQGDGNRLGDRLPSCEVQFRPPSFRHDLLQLGLQAK